MRKLHPVHARERLVDRGAYLRPAGVETWSLHTLPADRHVLRVQDEHEGLWHLVLDADDRPERLQVRLRRDGRRVEATLTFFEDEVLVWRRGASPDSEAIALPPGARLLWPPLAGRLRCLGFPTGAALPQPDQPEAVMAALVRMAPPAKGMLSVRPVKFTLRSSSTPSTAGADGNHQLRLATPGLPTAVATLDEHGAALRWHEEGGDGTPKDPMLLGEREVGATAPPAVD